MKLSANSEFTKFEIAQFLVESTLITMEMKHGRSICFYFLCLHHMSNNVFTSRFAGQIFASFFRKPRQKLRHSALTFDRRLLITLAIGWASREWPKLR